MIQLLEGVAIGGRSIDILHHRDDRDRGFQCFREARHEERGGGAVLGRDDCRLMRQSRESIGHRGTGVLGPVGELLESGVLGGQHQSGRQALRKKRLDAMSDECGGDGLCGRSRLRHFERYAVDAIGSVAPACTRMIAGSVVSRARIIRRESGEAVG